jgi:hypothetical protein
VPLQAVGRQTRHHHLHTSAGCSGRWSAQHSQACAVALVPPNSCDASCACFTAAGRYAGSCYCLLLLATASANQAAVAGPVAGAAAAAAAAAVSSGSPAFQPHASLLLCIATLPLELAALH